jgi:AraC family transcriptional regulator
MTDRAMRRLLLHVSSNLDEDLGLDTLAAAARRSRFDLHRRFAASVGETPKAFVERLRLDRAASLLATSDMPILDVALEVGFQSHEVFTRAFRRHFDTTPAAYRARSSVAPADVERHVETIRSVGPCVGLFRKPADESATDTKNRRTQAMPYEIVRVEMPEQPVLFARRRVPPSAIAPTLAEVLPGILRFAQQKGVALAGPPFCRYAAWGPLLTLEAGFPVATRAAGEGPIEAGVLGGGAVARTTHPGGYDKLGEAHAALQSWVEAQGLRPSGAGWESYVTDPGEKPNPEDWRTDVFLPI